MRIAIARNDGGVSIMILVDGADQNAEIAKWREIHQDEYVDHRIIREDEIPNDRTFRNALKYDLSVDMAKAREIWRDKIRAVRAPLLQTLDVAYQIADEKADAVAKAEIARKKQALRDATADPALDSAKDPDDLKKAWPVVLDEVALVTTSRTS